MVVVGRARLTWPGGRESGHGPATGPALGLSLREAVDSYTQTRRGAGDDRFSQTRATKDAVGPPHRLPQWYTRPAPHTTQSHQTSSQSVLKDPLQKFGLDFIIEPMEVNISEENG
ncbi:hypothetical protein Pcinc_033238 [Petrolisthes cinctipes]|uniref:Uncharacterized protein n=1 Tax=Petrolisthes cinctipes TaxID=88211 RepID=A0AAE1ESU0_PETCI|nr:hypothetical protein Pcinc_033238 [Petrolisthes cinctipes]